MRVILWGTRGSLASPGPETARYGGNTSCVEVLGRDGTTLILDAGTGLRRLGMALPPRLRRVDLLVTHLHVDHIEGLGFFDPVFRRDMEVHIWGPASTTLDLRTRLTSYLSPPFFPIHLRDLPCELVLHELARSEFAIGGFRVFSNLVCHPGPTVGYRIEGEGAVVAYLPDHEPALGVRDFPQSRDWTSGYTLAAGADLLIHDAQFSHEEYAAHVGWGHSSLRQALAFAALAGVKRLVPFHHDPAHTDDHLDLLLAQAMEEAPPAFQVLPGVEGAVFDLAPSAQTSRGAPGGAYDPAQTGPRGAKRH